MRTIVIRADDMSTLRHQRGAEDQKKMYDLDRWVIAGYCRGVGEQRCVIVHEPETLLATAEAVAQYNQNKVIVFVPTDDHPLSDDDALEAGGTIRIAGVYVRQDGHLFEWDQCVRDPDTGCFRPE